MSTASASLESIVGPGNVVQSNSSLTVFPESVHQVSEVVRFAKSDGLKLGVSGAGMRSYLGGTTAPDIVVGTSRLTEITDYQPENLVFCAQAGLTGAKAIEHLSQNNQMLALDSPGFWQGSLGGTVATRMQGPSAFGAGGVRDLLISVHVVNAEGDLVKGGAKVVKNVSGYDLPKLYAGSYGTLGIIVETSFKLAPYPERSVACIAELSDWLAAEMITEKVFISPLYPRSLEVLSPSAIPSTGLPSTSSTPVYLAVFDGSEEQLDFQKALFSQIVMDYGGSAVQISDMTWHSEAHKRYSDARLATKGSHFQIYCLSSDVSVIAEHIATNLAGHKPEIIAGIGSGLLDVLFPEATLDEHTELKQVIDNGKILKAGTSLTSHFYGEINGKDVWPDDIPGLTLMKQIKQALDPSGVFSSGRFAGGI